MTMVKNALIALALLAAVVVVFGASSDSLVWTGAANSDMNNVANYTEGLAGSPPAEIAATDTLFFVSGAAAATASANLVVHKVKMTTGYTGAWSLTGYGLLLTGPFINDGDNTQTYGTYLKLTGTVWDTLHFGTTIDTIIAPTCSLIVDGKYYIDADRTYPRFYDIKIIPDATDSIRLIGATPGIQFSNQITMGDGYLDMYNQDFHSYNVNQQLPVVLTGTPYITNTNAGAEHSLRLNCYPIAKLIITLPKLKMGYTVKTKLAVNNLGTDTLIVLQSDSVTCGIFELANNANNKVTIYHTQNKYLRQTAETRTGTNGVGTTQTDFYLDTSVFICRTITGGYTNSTGVNWYWGASTVTNDAPITIGPNGTSTPGTATITLANTGGGGISCNDKSLPNVVMNTGVSRSMTTALRCLSFSQSAGAGFNQNSQTMYVNGDFSVTGGAASTMNAATTITGNVTTGASANLTLAGAVWTLTKSGCVITSNGKTLPGLVISAQASTVGNLTCRHIGASVAGVKFSIASGTTLTLDSLSNTFGGTAGALDTLQGSGGSAGLSFAGGDIRDTASYLYVQNIALAAGDTLDLRDGTSIDGGGNTGAWIFPSSATNRRNRGWLGLGVWIMP